MIVRYRISVLVLSLFIVGCGGDELLPAYDLGGTAMGTTFTVTIIDPPADLPMQSLQAEIYATLEAIEDIASTYRSESEISRFNRNASTDWVTASPQLCAWIAAALDISAVTDGAFDITVGPLVNLWGFGPDIHEPQVPDDERIAATKVNVGYDKLMTDCERPAIRKTVAEIAIDLSGWAKGYAVDAVAGLLDDSNIENYLVEIGGELKVRGHNAERQAFAIAIEKPLTTDGMGYSVFRLSDTAVATSGDYRNFFEIGGERFSHTIDPASGRPVTHQLTGVTVLDESTAYADAMATALLVLGPDAGTELAEDLGLAGYFLLRTDTGLQEIRTGRFQQLRQ